MIPPICFFVYIINEILILVEVNLMNIFKLMKMMMMNLIEMMANKKDDEF